MWVRGSELPSPPRASPDWRRRGSHPPGLQRGTMALGLGPGTLLSEAGNVNLPPHGSPSGSLAHCLSVFLGPPPPRTHLWPQRPGRCTECRERREGEEAAEEPGHRRPPPNLAKTAPPPDAAAACELDPETGSQ